MGARILTVSAVGDCLFTAPFMQWPQLGLIARAMADADVRVANLECSLLEISQVPVAPPSECGNSWTLACPAAARDLRRLGLDIVSRANNHALDFGADGMALTSRALDDCQILHAGAGRDLEAARRPALLATASGPVALLSAATTYAPGSRALDPAGTLPGRPGVYALRSSRRCAVSREQLQVLQQLQSQISLRCGTPPPATPEEADLFGLNFRIGTEGCFTYSLDATDEARLLADVRQASALAFVIVALHTHEPGNWSEDPADGIVQLAHHLIDAGANMIVCAGPHRLRAIEVYRRRPIFYSLGNFLFQFDFHTSGIADRMEQFRQDLGASRAELAALADAARCGDQLWHQSVVATSEFCDGQVAEIRLAPLDLHPTPSHNARGIPAIASRPVGDTILETIQRLSRQFGAVVCIEDGTGVIHL